MNLVELEFGELVFMEGGKLENLEKNPQSKTRTNNKLNPHMASGRNHMGHIGERRALSPPHHPCPLVL